MTLIEIAAVAFGVLCVWLTIRQNIWCWPTGLAMVLLYIVIFYEARLYSDMLLQVVYVFLQIYGWHYWLRGRRDAGEGVVVTRLAPQAAVAWLALAAVASTALGTFMYRYTDADLPGWDASMTVLSLIAQWLMGRKVLESWVVWIVVDVLSIGIYTTKGLYLTAGLYTLFLILATIGFFTWARTTPRSVTA